MLSEKVCLVVSRCRTREFLSVSTRDSIQHDSYTADSRLPSPTQPAAGRSLILMAGELNSLKFRSIYLQCQAYHSKEYDANCPFSELSNPPPPQEFMHININKHFDCDQTGKIGNLRC